MNKSELIRETLHTVRSTHERSVILTDVEKTLDALGTVIAAELLGGGEIPLPGAGKHKVKKRAARKGRNPQTGETINIPAGKKIVFIPFKELKDALR